MRPVRHLLTACIPLVLTLVVPFTSFARADGPTGKLQVLTPKAVGIIATGINNKGDVVGFEWAEETERAGILEQKPFLAAGKSMTYLPLLKTYTATFPAAVSDDGTVVGRAGKAAPPGGPRVMLRNQAFIWDAKGGIRGLGAMEGDWSSFACGISRDGHRISGFSVGDSRVRACVWDREGLGGGWKAKALPQASRLGSTTVVISGDGNRVAAVDGTAPCLWSRDASGNWTREVIGPDSSLLPRAVNDSGTVVGLHFAGDGTTHAVVWTRGGGPPKALEEPPGYMRSEASAVNDEGVVVGMLDGPNGSPIGPRAFAVEKGRLRLMDEGGPFFTSATAINNRGQVAGVLEEPEEPHAEPKPPAP